MTSNEFEKKYPRLYRFLIPFIIQTYEDVSDEYIIKDNFEPEYFRNSNDGIRVLKEVEDLFHSEEPFPKEAIEEITNMWHENMSTKDWLKGVIEKLEKKIKEFE